MKGHTYQRGKTWSYVVDAGKDENGKRQQSTKGGFPTEREARKALNLVLVQLDQGTYTKPTEDNVATFMRSWLDSIRASVRPSSTGSTAKVSTLGAVRALRSR